jgi:hypothetical protein
MCVLTLRVCKAAQIIYLHSGCVCVWDLCYTAFLWYESYIIYIMGGCVNDICAMLLFSGMTVMCLYLYVT